MAGPRTEKRPLVLLAGLTLTVSALAAMVPTDSSAQSSDNVSVNLDALNDLDPAMTQPRLLMPSTQPRSGRIVLTPPAGVSAITPQSQRVVLRPPPGAPARISSAPTIAVPQPAAAAAAPPTSVTAPPEPQPKPVEATVAAPVPAEPPPPPAPIVATPSPAPAPAAPAGPSVETAAAPMQSEPEEAAMSTPEEPATETQVAAVPAEPEADETMSVEFGPGETELPATASGVLTPLAEKMAADTSLRVQLLAYAGGADAPPSTVRRTSLSRALSVREYLMDQGVQSTRIEVRALGDQSEGGNPDRVDAIIDRR